MRALCWGTLRVSIIYLKWGFTAGWASRGSSHLLITHSSPFFKRWPTCCHQRRLWKRHRPRESARVWMFAWARPCFPHAPVCSRVCVCLCYHSPPEYPLESLHAADTGCEKSGIECCPNATALICYLKREWLLMKFNQTTDYLNWAR